MHVLWVNPEVAIQPEGSLNHRVPLESLVCPFSTRQPDGNHPVLIYAFLDEVKAVSNVIVLKHPERIPWGPPKSGLLLNTLNGL
jgi:hypothetical protein